MLRQCTDVQTVHLQLRLRARKRREMLAQKLSSRRLVPPYSLIDTDGSKECVAFSFRVEIMRLFYPED
jgi:hypothetical protein